MYNVKKVMRDAVMPLQDCRDCWTVGLLAERSDENRAHL